MSRFAELQQLIARRDPVVVAHGVSAILIAALAVQAARIGWALLAPLGPVGAVPPHVAPASAAADFASLDRFDPFHRGTQAARPDANVGALRLFGVRVGPQSSAIIARPDGRQVSVAVGEEIAPGVTLRAVAPDHVELLVQGRRTTLAFTPSSGVGAAPSMPVIPAPSAPAVGAVLTPGSAAAAQLAGAGLQPGDVVTSVNGLAVSDPQSIEAIGRDLAGGSQAVVQYQRDGQVRTATLKVPEQ